MAEIISSQALADYINANSSSLTQNQIVALNKINSYYATNSCPGYQLIQSNLGKPILFFFEGLGGFSSDFTVSLYNPARYNLNDPNDYSINIGDVGYDPPGFRYSAMVVVIKKDAQTGNNIIAGIFKDASTLPDQPKGNACDNGNDVPTLLPGVYQMTYTILGKGKNGYPALNIVTTPNNVVRYGLTGWYASTAYGIDIHRGAVEVSTPEDIVVQYFSIDPDATWAYSDGCQIIKSSDYSSFEQIVGFDKNLNNRIDREDKISGCVIIDRSFMGDKTARPDLQKLYGDDGLSLIKGPTT